MKTIAELRAYIESRFPIVEGLCTAFCQTGEPYVMLWFGYGAEPGVLPPGAPALLAVDEETAAHYARAAFDAYADGRKGTLYLRHPIILESWPFPQFANQRKADRPLRHRIRLRLVISDKPVKWPTIEAMNASREVAA